MPDYRLLRLDAVDDVITYLREREWLPSGESVRSISAAGEGNMNLVLRIVTSERSLILKQSRPWVEKYPQFAAPEERLLTEVAFYRVVADLPAVAAGMPDLLAVDSTNRVALFSDLGDAPDYSSLYADPIRDPEPFRYLAGWLSALHAAGFPEPVRGELRNREMRELNHAHLFVIPLQADNGLDLDAITPGLGDEAARLRANRPFVDAIRALGDRYLQDGQTLLHGDFYPGSWLRTEHGPRVIDPEFCFFGPAEYDVGVWIAHLMMAGYSDAVIAGASATYGGPEGSDPALTCGFAGMEIMRRLIGYAQLPLDHPIEQKRDLLKRAVRLVLET